MSWDEAVMPRVGSSTEEECRPGRAGEHAPDTTVIHYERRGVRVVAAHGSYDTHSITPLTAALDTAARERAKVVLDASGIAFADSALLNLLIRTHRAATLRVAAPRRQLRRLFELTGLDEVLQTRETVDDAVVS
ncbi:STAS domain-containing protein [Streptomyces sediminimaris]|uniref:STAS domain-containing protein n=1 Tax=Streptomyces sediminimaris TaxID=3383721 RepID=UPI003999FC52